MDTAAIAARPDRRPVIALLAANGISLVGNQLTLVAIPWFVLQTSGSATRTGLTSVVGLLPLLIGGLLGGAIVDQLGFRRTSVASDLGSAALVALIPLLHHTVGLAFWQLLLIVFARSLIGTPGGTARLGLLPDLIARSGYRRERVNATSQGIFNLGSLLGAPLAGGLIVALGPSNVLWLDAASFLLSAAIVALAVPRPARTPTTATPDAPGAGLLAGLRFIGGDRALLPLILTGTVINFFFAPLGGVIMPVHAAQKLGGPVALGAIFALGAVGGLLGTALYGLLGPRLPRRASFVGAFLVSAIPLGILAATPPFLPTAAAILLSNLALAPLSPLLMTILQERVPSALRGRVFGMLTALILAAAPLGLVLAGIALDALGLRRTLLAMACAYLVVAVGTAFNPALRGLDAARPDPRDDRPPTGPLAPPAPAT